MGQAAVLCVNNGSAMRVSALFLVYYADHLDYKICSRGNLQCYGVRHQSSPSLILSIPPIDMNYSVQVDEHEGARQTQISTMQTSMGPKDERERMHVRTNNGVCTRERGDARGERRRGC